MLDSKVEGPSPFITVTPKKSPPIIFPPNSVKKSNYRFPEKVRTDYCQSGQETVQRGSADINGPAALLSRLGNIQAEYGVVGSIGEIGVHHGKFFVSIAHLARGMFF